MKKSIIFLIIFILTFIPMFGLTANADYYNMQLPELKSEAYLLVNTDTNTTVFSHNADKQLKCASLVKTATAIVTVENCENLDAVVTVTESMLAPLANITSASCDLLVGEQISVRNLMYCMMLENANDAANVLAEYIGGTIENFIKMMNDKAKELGCKNTNFTNAHGLDEEGEYTSANDMYILTKYAITNSVLADMGSMVDYTVPATNMSDARELNTRTDIVERGSRYFYDYAKGFKSGQTDEAERCASVVATKDAYTYICIVLGCPNECVDKCGYPDNTALYQAKKMLQWAFKNLKLQILAEPTHTLKEVPVALSTQADHVRLVPETQIRALLRNTVDESSIEYVFETNEDIKAPVKKGDVLGKVKVKYANNIVAEVNLVAADSVGRSGLLHFGYILKVIFTSRIFFIILALALAGIIIYFLVTYNKKAAKKPKKKTKQE